MDTSEKEIRRAELVAVHGEGNVWDTDQLGRDFEVIGFAAPQVVVRRKSDGQRGTLWFEHSPRFYYGFEAVK